MASPGASVAETPAVTAQAQSADAAFLAYAPAPPGPPAALCLIDTGVNLNADTQPEVVYRTAVDGGTPDDVDSYGNPGHHGTTMAMIAGAAINGVGMIGVWPQIKIVSIRAATVPPPGQPATFPFTNYSYALRQCQNYRSAYNVLGAEMAIGGGQPSPSAQADLQNEVASAHASGINVVAGVGNEGAQTIDSPASTYGVFAVGAADAYGVLCSFSNRGPGMTAIAPGCHLDEADPITLQPFHGGNGTSQASAFTAAVLVAMRAYSTSLTWNQAEAALQNTSQNGNIDVAAAFRSVGLGAIVDAGNANIPSQPPTTGPSAPGGNSPGDSPGARGPALGSGRKLAKPRVRSASWRGGWLTIRVASVPGGAHLKVRIVVGKKTRTFMTSRTTLRVRVGRPSRIDLTFVEANLRSDPVRVLHFR